MKEKKSNNYTTNKKYRTILCNIKWDLDGRGFFDGN